MITSFSSRSVTPSLLAMPKWARNCSVLPLVINASHVIRLRSRGASSGRAQTSPNKRSSVSSTSCACGLRKTGWVDRPRRAVERLAVQGAAIALTVRTSSRPLRTKAGIPVIASSSQWMLGRTSWAVAFRGRRGVLDADRRLGQIEQVGPLGFVHLQRGDQRVQDRLRDTTQIAPLQPGLVLDITPAS